jgi:hypothetical protein
MGGRILFTVVGGRCRVRWVRVLRRRRAGRSLRSHRILPLVAVVRVLAILLPLVAGVVVDIRPEAEERTSSFLGIIVMGRSWCFHDWPFVLWCGFVGLTLVCEF